MSEVVIEGLILEASNLRKRSVHILYTVNLSRNFDLRDFALGVPSQFWQYLQEIHVFMLVSYLKSNSAYRFFSVVCFLCVDYRRNVFAGVIY